VNLRTYVATLALTTAAVVVVGTGAVHIWAAYERLEQRSLSVRRDSGAVESVVGPSLHVGGDGAQPTLRTLATRAARLCGVPPAVLHNLVARESSWRQHDAQGRTLRSSAGALGLTQIKQGSAREISPTLDPHDPWQNLVAGACYLSKYRRGGTWRESLIRYRLGPNYRRTTHAARAYADTIMEGIE
jgi:soluble lytic murein transglycosylase-like protein